MQDDELKEALRQAREPDRDAAPSYGATWAKAAERGGASRRRVWIGAAALAAVVAAVIVFWPDATGRIDAPSDSEPIARTDPLPDIPTDDETDPSRADWRPAPIGDTPTDFLLQDRGLVSGDLPGDELPTDDLLGEDVLDLDDESLREL